VRFLGEVERGFIDGEAEQTLRTHGRVGEGDGTTARMPVEVESLEARLVGSAIDSGNLERDGVIGWRGV
jgi:hypothetical protein